MSRKIHVNFQGKTLSSGELDGAARNRLARALVPHITASIEVRLMLERGARSACYQPPRTEGSP